MPNRRTPAGRRTGPLLLPVLLAAAVAVTGCAKAPRTHYYLLQLPGTSPASPSSPAGDATAIGVSDFAVDPPYDGDRIVYRVGESSPEVGFYAYHRWAAPLSRALPGLTADALRGPDGLAALEVAAPGHRYPATLHGRLALLEEVDLADSQRVRVRLSLSLRGRNGRELWSGTVEEQGETRTDRVSVIVDEAAAALGRALARVRPELEAAARSIPEDPARGTD